jgi:hypothetical protein
MRGKDSLTMNESEVRAVFARLFEVCHRFVSTAGPGADIRDYGLTPELLAACADALATWQPRPMTVAPGTGGDAAFQAYQYMVTAHGEEFS